MNSKIKSRLAKDCLLIFAIIIVTATRECLTVSPKIQIQANPTEDVIGGFLRDNLNRLESTGRGFANHLINTIQEAPAVAASELMGDSVDENGARSFENAAIRTAFTDKRELADSPLAGGATSSEGFEVSNVYAGYWTYCLSFIKEFALKFNLPYEIIVEKFYLVIGNILETILTKCNFIIRYIENAINPDECMLRTVCIYSYNFKFAKSFVEKINPVTLQESIFVKAVAHGITRSQCEESFACASGSAGSKSMATAGFAGRDVSKTQIKGPSQY